MGLLSESKAHRVLDEGRLVRRNEFSVESHLQFSAEPKMRILFGILIQDHLKAFLFKIIAVIASQEDQE
jgi:hypothetical protein